MEKQDKYGYPAVFEYDEDGISISFPDLPGCVTCAKDDASALRMAKDALGGHMWAREDFGEEIPAPTQMVNIHSAENQRVVLVEVYMLLIRDAINAQSVKKTLTIPAWMNEAAENAGVNFSQLLQAWPRVREDEAEERRPDGSVLQRGEGKFVRCDGKLRRGMLT